MIAHPCSRVFLPLARPVFRAHIPFRLQVCRNFSPQVSRVFCSCTSRDFISWIFCICSTSIVTAVQACLSLYPEASVPHLKFSESWIMNYWVFGITDTLILLSLQSLNTSRLLTQNCVTGLDCSHTVPPNCVFCLRAPRAIFLNSVGCASGQLSAQILMHWSFFIIAFLMIY